jgi:hypothetical protein
MKLRVPKGQELLSREVNVCFSKTALLNELSKPRNSIPLFQQQCYRYMRYMVFKLGLAVKVLCVVLVANDDIFK